MPELKQKVRMRSKLPATMHPNEWLALVRQDRPARTVLGAMAFYERHLCVIAWMGGKIHAVPVSKAKAGSVLHQALDEQDRAALDQWLHDHGAGKFDAIIAAEKERVALW